MNLNVGALAERAYQTVIKQRILWLLGFIAVLLAGTVNTQFRVVGPDWRVRLIDGELPITAEWAALLALTALVVGITFFLLRAVFDAALIAAGDRSLRDEPPTFRAAWQAGQTGMGPVIVLNLIFAGFLVLLGLAVAALLALAGGGAVLTALLTADNQALEALRLPALIGWGLLAVAVVFLVAVPVGIALAVTTQLAQRAAVLDHQPIGAAWRTGWRLMRAHPGHIVLLLFTQWLVLLAADLIVGAILAVAVGVPGGMLATNTGEVSALLVLGVLLLAVGAWLGSGVLLALPTAWSSLLWTAFYREVTADAPHSPPLPFAGRVPPVPGVSR